MMRILFILFLILIAGYLFFQGRVQHKSNELPVFFKLDQLAIEHKTDIELKVLSDVQPDSLQLQRLEKDYSNLWAHLNHLYATNDIRTGKEYYTEDLFKQFASNYDKPMDSRITRKDLKHQLNIINWSRDGLVCSVIDSSLIFSYTYPGQEVISSEANIAMVLLFQGDHWRLDAIRVLDEEVLDRFKF